MMLLTICWEDQTKTRFGNDLAGTRTSRSGRQDRFGIAIGPERAISVSLDGRNSACEAVPRHQPTHRVWRLVKLRLQLVPSFDSGWRVVRVW